MDEERSSPSQVPRNLPIFPPTNLTHTPILKLRHTEESLEPNLKRNMLGENMNSNDRRRGGLNKMFQKDQIKSFTFEI